MSHDKTFEQIGIREFRNNLKETLRRVDVNGERLLLGKHGRNVAALVPVEDVHLAVKMEKQLAEAAMQNPENLPGSESSETSLEQLLADYHPADEDPSRYEPELDDALESLNRAFHKRAMHDVESALMAVAIKKLAEIISTSPNIASIATSLQSLSGQTGGLSKRTSYAVEQTKAVAVVETVVSPSESLIERTEFATEQTEVAAAITEAVRHAHD
ncbi:type II toxin-antitoxin system Phd/YefM family antitoxin [Bowmanella dokdonensis]|uniref:Antitoxin n=1 Tax=Bowmanella dokdonensis TaxID=751969 RepID=A0A939DRB1_9ALTE|nr:type II toxin-antitoxin system prevent-host-death family antitoxin [Bowmanella dokdonensis]MBN7827377.1 type II toxin-antitoxin system Phd/YefM family antitoxin [Bowmanella dokdonensis]